MIYQGKLYPTFEFQAVLFIVFISVVLLSRDFRLSCIAIGLNISPGVSLPPFLTTPTRHSVGDMARRSGFVNDKVESQSASSVSFSVDK